MAEKRSLLMPSALHLVCKMFIDNLNFRLINVLSFNPFACYIHNLYGYIAQIFAFLRLLLRDACQNCCRGQSQHMFHTPMKLHSSVHLALKEMHFT